MSLAEVDDYSSFYTVVDKMFNYVTFIAVLKEYPSETDWLVYQIAVVRSALILKLKTVELFVRYTVKYYDVSKSIVSDSNAHFLSKFGGKYYWGPTYYFLLTSTYRQMDRHSTSMHYWNITCNISSVWIIRIWWNY